MENYLKERLDFLEKNSVDIFMNINYATDEITEARRKIIRRLMLRLFTSRTLFEEDPSYDLYKSYVIDGVIQLETLNEEFDDMSRGLFMESVLTVLDEEAKNNSLNKEEMQNYRLFIIKASELLESERFHIPGMIKERNAKIPVEL